MVRIQWGMKGNFPTAGIKDTGKELSGTIVRVTRQGRMNFMRVKLGGGETEDYLIEPGMLLGEGTRIQFLKRADSRSKHGQKAFNVKQI